VTSRAGVESCDVTFTSVTVDELWSQVGVKRLGVEARLLGQNSFAGEVLFRASGSIGTAISGVGGRGGGCAALGSARFNANHNRGVELAVFERRGVMCFSRQRTVTTKTFNPLQHCSNKSLLDGTATTVVLPKIVYTDPKITVTFNIRVS